MNKVTKEKQAAHMLTAGGSPKLRQWSPARTVTESRGNSGCSWNWGKGGYNWS